jgi:5-methylcytosine-specific restriction endonuclease McrA
MSSKRHLNSERKRRFVQTILCGRPYVECHYCGTHIGYGSITLDHVQPISKGGAMGLRNIVPACRSCNTTRGNLEYELFIKRFKS